MEIKLHIKPSFKTVYIANGVFYENMDNFIYRAEDVLYLTVFPLDSLLLPYTLKLVGGVALNNENLVQTYKLPNGHVVVKLERRHNIAYSAQRRDPEQAEHGMVKLFFDEIKSGNVVKARGYLTDELSGSISDENLAAFFNDFIDVIENNGYTSAKNAVFLINKNFEGIPFIFDEFEGKIDNISDA